MRVLFSPVRSDEKVSYEFIGEKIIITFNGYKEEYDFTNMPNGLLEEFETDFPFKFIVSAVKEQEVLSVVLVNFIDEDATEEERFPNWIEV